MSETVEVDAEYLQHLIKESKDIRQVYLDKFKEKWNQECSYILKKIKLVIDLDDKGFLKSDTALYGFKWSLVRQECEMYCLLGEEIEPEEFQTLCKRRGFDDNMIQFLKKMMKHVGLGDKL